MISDEVRRKIDILSPTEREVLELVCEGLKYKEIKDRLHMSVSAIKTHMTAVRLKFGIDQLSQWETTIEINNTYCSALKELREQSDKERSGVIAPEVETKTEPKTESKPDLEPQDKEKENTPEKEPEIEKDQQGDDINKEKEAEKPTEDVIDKEDKKNAEKSDTPKQKLPVGEKDNKKKDGYPMKKADQPKPDRFRSIKTIWRIISIVAIVFSGYVIYDRFFSTPPAQPAASTEESSPGQDVSTADAEALPTGKTSITEIPTEAEIVSTEIPTPELASSLKPAILFEDDFEKGLSDSWEIVSGNPMIVNGTLSTDRDTWLLVGDSSWENYSIEFTSNSPSGWYWEGFNTLGVRVNTIDNMYAYKWAEYESGCYILENGDWNEVPQSDFIPGTYLKDFRFTIVDDLFTVYLDGEKQTSFFDTRYSQGKIALKLFADTVIDDFKVREILE